MAKYICARCEEVFEGSSKSGQLPFMPLSNGEAVTVCPKCDKELSAKTKPIRDEAQAKIDEILLDAFGKKEGK